MCHLVSKHWGFATRPKVWFLREDKVSLDPPRSCGLTETDRMGRAELEECALTMGVCLLFLVCAVMNGTLLSSNPCCHQASRERGCVVRLT